MRTIANMNRLQRLLHFLISIAVFATDRITKIIAVQGLEHSSISVIPGVLSWSLVYNRGIAFSMLSGKRLLTILPTAVLIIAIIIYMLTHPKLPHLSIIGLNMIIGGGIGNLYDRILLGSVVDFIKTDFIDFAVFNVADIFVCIGCALTLISVLIIEHKEKNQRV